LSSIIGPGRLRWHEDLLTWPDIAGRARNPAGFKQDVMTQFLVEAGVLFGFAPARKAA
jgi:hypothetical protein